MDLSRYLHPLGERAPAMEATLVGWARQNSGSGHLEGLAAMHALLAEAFSHRLGAEPETLPLPAYTELDGSTVAVGAALRLRKHPEAPVQVLLSGHMDTVFGPADPFQSCRREADGRLIGPGVADMKGGLVVMLEALAALEASPLAGALGWTVLLTADEEIGSHASHALLREEARRHHLGLVYESALPGGEMIGTRKGNGSFLATVLGRAAHTGRDPEAGRNAIVHLAAWILAMETLPARFPGVTVNVGRIGGGGPLNIVPDRARAEWNLRLPAEADAEAIAAALREQAARHHAVEGFEFAWQGDFTRPPLALSPARAYWLEAFAVTGRTLGLELGRRDTGGSSDGNLLHAAGLPVLDGIGVRGGELHSPREFALLDSLVERARLSALFLLRLAAGEIALPPTP
jgi:glutamate carboxypeptidase